MLIMEQNNALRLVMKRWQIFPQQILIFTYLRVNASGILTIIFFYIIREKMEFYLQT